MRSGDCFVAIAPRNDALLIFFLCCRELAFGLYQLKADTMRTTGHRPAAANDIKYLPNPAQQPLQIFPLGE